MEDIVTKNSILVENKIKMQYRNCLQHLSYNQCIKSVEIIYLLIYLSVACLLLNLNPNDIIFEVLILATFYNKIH